MKYSFWIIALLLNLSVYAQDSTDEIESDRPDESETPLIITKGYLQFEFGFNKESEDKDFYTIVHPTGLIRYGLSRNIELRFEFNDVTNHYNVDGNKFTVSGLEVPELGAKLKLLDEKGVQPAISVIGAIGLPFLASNSMETQEPTGLVRLAFLNTLSKAAELEYNIGLQWEGESSSPLFAYTFTPGIDLSERWSTYIEIFGFIGKENYHDHNLGTGLVYKINKDLQADISGSLGLSAGSKESLIAIGFSYRIPLRKSNH